MFYGIVYFIPQYVLLKRKASIDSSNLGDRHSDICEAYLG